jgi:hypothetical protein
MRLESKYFSDELQLPGPGKVTAKSYSVPPGVLFDVHCSFFVDKDRAGVRISQLGSDDALSVVAFPHTQPKMPAPGVLYAGTVWHASAPGREHCTVVCDDGTKGECCVTCKEGRSVTKICC